MLAVCRLVVAASWIGLFIWFGTVWWNARRSRSEAGRRTGPASMLGMILEFVALGIVFGIRVPDPGLPAIAYIFAAFLAIGSAALGVLAGAHLGKQLRIQAVVTEDHRLITSGPYSVLRHPIFTSLFGLMIATGLVNSDVRWLPVAIVVFVVGTEIRIRAEDRLLASHFGFDFEQYRRRVRAYLPGLR